MLEFESSTSLHSVAMTMGRSQPFCDKSNDSLGHNVQNLPSPPVTPKKRRYSTYSELLASFSPRKQPLSESHRSVQGNSHLSLSGSNIDDSGVKGALDETRMPKSNRSDHAPSIVNIYYANGSEGSKAKNGFIPQNRLLREDSEYVTDACSLHIAENQKTSEIWRRVTAFLKIKRDNFLLAHKADFLPLLPSVNYITDISGKQEITGAMTKYEKVRQPQGVHASMKPYQLDGLAFLVHMFKNCASCILGDEMGLGKTLQTLALFQFLKEDQIDVSQKGIRGFSLIICPLSVLDSWVKESHKWTPGLRVVQLHGTVDQRRTFKADLSRRMQKRFHQSQKPAKDDANLPDAPFSGYDLIITTYEVFFSEQKWLKSTFIWRYVVLDEGHRIKNGDAALSKALLNLKAEHRLLLTGTPLHNNLLESWSLLHWLYPDVFTAKTADLFKRSFDLSKGSVSTSFLDSVQGLLKLIMLRRLKEDSELDFTLPSKSEVLLFVPLTNMQRDWYTKLLTSSQDTISIFEGADLDVERIKSVNSASRNGFTDEYPEKDILIKSNHQSQKAKSNNSTEATLSQDGKKISKQMLLNLIMQLRKCCIHPYLIPGAQPNPYETGEHVIHTSGKFVMLEKLLLDIVGQKGEKVLVFSGFASVLDLCEELINHIGTKTKKMSYLRLDGGTRRARRNLHIRLFQNFDFPIMLLTTRAGGLGITLTAASNVIFLDEDWNPQMTLQAEGRAHRIGQTRPVTIFKLCTQGTVEEQMRGRIQKKLYLSTRVTSSVTLNNQGQQSSPESENAGKRKYDTVSDFNESQLKSLVRRGAQVLAHSVVDIKEFLAWDLATTIQNCKSKSIDDYADDHKSLTEAEEEKWLSTMERVQCAVFEGRRHDRIKPGSNSSSSVELMEEPRRRRKLTTNIDGFAVLRSDLSVEKEEKEVKAAKLEKKRAIMQKDFLHKHQKHCQKCRKSGNLTKCGGCPRAYHLRCLSELNSQKYERSNQFICPQHSCSTCYKNAHNTGGLLFRCSSCDASYCEICLDWDHINLRGDTLPELEELGLVGVNESVYHIDCAKCAKRE